MQSEKYCYEETDIAARSVSAFDEVSFRMNRVRLEVLGQLNDNLSYHFRQSFNKYSNPHSVDNLSSLIEYAYIKWHHQDKFELVAGKQFLAVAGYEGYVNGLKVREFSDFNNNGEIYLTGLMGVVKFSPTQHLMMDSRYSCIFSTKAMI